MKYMLLLLGVLGLVLGGEALAEESHIELSEALARGQVHCTILAGEDLTYAVVRIQSYETSPIIVVIVPGTRLVPAAAGYQTMGVIERVTVYLLPGEEKEVLVRTACLDMDLPQPEAQAALIVSPADPRIARICLTRAFGEAGFRVRQFAIWTLLTCPESPDDYAGLGFGEEFFNALEELGFPLDLLIYFMIVPEVVYELSAEELAIIALAFTYAGIPVDPETAADDLYRLFTTGGPTTGELRLVREIFTEAGIPIEEFPALNF